MLFIRAVNYVISQIEHHLAERLRIDLQKDSVEETLADKLKINIETKRPRIQEPAASSSHQALGQEKKEDKKEKEADEQINGKQNDEQEDADSKEKAKKPGESQEPLSEQMQALSLKEIPQNASPLTTLPSIIEHPLQLKDFAQHANENNVITDELNLRLVGKTGALKWKDFVLSTEEDFKGHLENDLKNETLTDKKMFILIRLSRQLKDLCERATSDLSKKEQGQETIDCIDTTLWKLVQARIDEASRLAKTALSSSLITYESRFLPEISTKAKPGGTEVMLFAIKKMLEEFLEFCVEENKKRKLGSTKDKGSMLDVLASKIRELNNPLMIIDQNACDYLIENLYNDAMYFGYEHYGQYKPMSMQGYDPELAKTKRQKILLSLATFCEIITSTEAKADKTDCYSQSLDEIDRLAGDLKAITPTLAYYMGREQKSVAFCEDIHTVLKLQASSLAPQAALKHQKCSFK